ncbi:alpha/beta fold hydrolase [Aurantiacibacter zhengii]|uniref:Alpha/beta fold hydrolase n=1 Tax=Aurantiacibacter zhengii TaxID=2307003 RepID=A0A418NVM5_9SPHN|nr:alpha/beta fold hydrolase [Aurantiacibacter zhengii]
METSTQGSGSKLLLVHGLGGSGRSWAPIIPLLTEQREVITVDLPGHGNTPARADSGTFAGLADDLQEYIQQNDLGSNDIAGFSLGGRLVLEMARRGCAGNVVALNPGGFWRGWERTYFKWTLTASHKLLSALKDQLGTLSGSAVSRTALLAQLSARPWALDGPMVEKELVTFAETSTVVPLIKDLAKGPAQKGPSSPHAGRVSIAWGEKDRLCPPRQAPRARTAFPLAAFHWIEDSGHYSLWDRPEEVADIILEGTGSD